MAGPAEAVQTNNYQEQPPVSTPEVLYQSPQLIDIDSIPELFLVRLEAYETAEAKLSHNAQLLRAGHAKSVPLPVNGASTARRYVQAVDTFGKNSLQAEALWQGLLLDKTTLLSEASRKNTAEYSPESLLQRDPKTGDYYSGNRSMTEAVDNGLSPAVEPEEQQVRIWENVEEATSKAIGAIALGSTVTKITIQECTDWALEAYVHNPKGSFGGYVPSKNKYVLRSDRFVETGDRYQSQLAIPGIHITPDVFIEVLQDSGGLQPGEAPSKMERRSKHFIDLNGGDIFDFQAQLDQKASQKTGLNIFLGEVVAPEHPKDYAAFKQEAAARRQTDMPEAEELAQYAVELVRAGFDDWTASGMITRRVDETLKRAAHANPDLAEAMFDAETADRYREANRLEAAGDGDGGRNLRDYADANAPEPSFCGVGGSCGIEAVNPVSSEAVKARDLGLRGADLMHDTERSCPKCSKREVYYDGYGSKACLGCEYTNIK